MSASNTEKSFGSPAAATPANLLTAPDKHKTAAEPQTVGLYKNRTEHRKSSKPIMEKRRRARINESLCQLKALMLNALKRDTSTHSKLEKADILEMTVRHLKNLQQLQMTGVFNTDPSVIGKFRAGFNECMNEVTRFLSTYEGVDTAIRTNLLGHLASCIGHINNCQAQHPVAASASHLRQPLVQVAFVSSSHSVVCKNDFSASCPTETATFCNGFQIIPATDGKCAFLIPNSAFMTNLFITPRGTGGNQGDGGPVVANDSVWRPW